MTSSEIALWVVAASMLAIGIAVVVLVLRLLPLLRRVNRLLRRTNATMVRVNRISAEAEEMSRDARLLERRVARTAHDVLDQVEPVVRMAGAVFAGVRAATGALFK